MADTVRSSKVRMWVYSVRRKFSTLRCWRLVDSRMGRSLMRHSMKSRKEGDVGEDSVSLRLSIMETVKSWPRSSMRLTSW